MALKDLPPYLQEAASSRRFNKAREAAVLGSRMDLASMPPVWEWGAQGFYLYDTATIIPLHPIMVAGLKEATKLTVEGKFKYSTVLWSFPKKSGKSSIIAMVTDWMAVHRARSQIRLAANDRKQADSRVGHYLRESIKLGAKLGYAKDPTGQLQQFRQATKISSSSYNITYPNGTIIEMVAADPSGEAGGNDDMLVFSELWGWKTKAHQQLWSEMTISPTRFGYAQRWVDTYAGFKDESTVLWNLYEKVVRPENRISQEYEFYATDNTFAAWVTGPHFDWQTREYYVQERESLEESEYQRLHRNQWSTTRSAFAPKNWLANCTRTLMAPKGVYNNPAYIPPRHQDEELVIAIDAATDSDCFAIIAGTKVFEKDELTDMRVAKFVLRYSKAWYPEEYEGTFDFDEPLEEILRLCNENNVIQVCYDKWQLKHFIDILEEKNIAWFDSFDQQSERDISDKLLYDMIRRKHFIHWGDPDFCNHYGNASKKVDGKRLRIIKGDKGGQIDLIVAASMCNKRAMDLIADI